MTVNGNGIPTEKDLLEIAKKIKFLIGESKAVIDGIKQILKII